MGRQRAFELGNPFYAHFSQDGKYWRKELPTGEKFFVLFGIIYDDEGDLLEIKDTFLCELIDDANPELIFVRGCNAAGKSSFIRTRLNELSSFEIIMPDVYKSRAKEIFYFALNRKKRLNEDAFNTIIGNEDYTLIRDSNRLEI